MMGTFTGNPDQFHGKNYHGFRLRVSQQNQSIEMGLSENSVPLHPMVLLIIIPTKWLFHWGYTPFSDIHK